MGEGFVEPIVKTAGRTAVSFCFVWTVDGFVSTTLVCNVAVTIIASYCPDAVESWIEIGSSSFDVVMGILVFYDDVEEASGTGNPVSYTVV